LAGCQDDWPDAGYLAHLVVTDAQRRPLAIVLAANVVSVTGSSLTLIGVPWFVPQSTGSAADAGIVAFCAMLPVALAALAGGPLVDRLDGGGSVSGRTWSAARRSERSRCSSSPGCCGSGCSAR
jgi:hypothetical protein